MNDTTQTLLRAVLKIGAGVLVTKGFTDSSHAEEGMAAVLALAGIIWGILHRSSGPAKAGTPNAGSGTVVPLLFLSLGLGLGLIGCTIGQQKAAYNSIYSLEKTASAAYDGYLSAVFHGQVPTNDVPAVARAFNDFQAAELLALDGVQFNTNAIAPESLVTESQDLLNLINTISNKRK